MVFKNGNYTLYTRKIKWNPKNVQKKNKEFQIYFFAKNAPRSGSPSDMPNGYTMKLSKNGMPYLKFSGNKISSWQKYKKNK